MRERDFKINSIEISLYVIHSQTSKNKYTEMSASFQLTFNARCDYDSTASYII